MAQWQDSELSLPTARVQSLVREDPASHMVWAKKKEVFHLCYTEFSFPLFLINWLLFEDCSHVHSCLLSFRQNILIPPKGHHRTRFHVFPPTSHFWKHGLTDSDGQAEDWSRATTIPLFQRLLPVHIPFVYHHIHCINNHCTLSAHAELLATGFKENRLAFGPERPGFKI